MKFLVVVLSVSLTLALAADDKAAERPKTFRRLIPADTLRDFPGLCFASTRCATIEPGKSWELAPFCGRSTCVLEEGRLLELVEDCGPLPKPNPKCKLSESTNKTAEFPTCCPIFECEEGVKLEYPDLAAPPAEAAADKSTEKPKA
ncbi:uncharacterized protein LOC135941748 [Cloeon dipterum]|uniref:uncharacterized protein LOC135941748 n=1 Tax=Cloeon dipterum TaxID=197152 RepID=UPI0032207293